MNIYHSLVHALQRGGPHRVDGDLALRRLSKAAAREHGVEEAAAGADDGLWGWGNELGMNEIVSITVTENEKRNNVTVISNTPHLTLCARNCSPSHTSVTSLR